MLTDPSESRPLSARTLAALSLPQLPLAALYFPVFVYLSAFYAEERGLDLAALGVVLILARLVDAVTDPLIGQLSDRWRTRFGRRKIWLAFATPLVCVSVWMTMVPPEDVTIGYFAFWITALTLSWTLALTPYFAWTAEISTSYAGRARVAAWRETGFLIGTFAAAALYAQSGGGGAGLEAIAIAVVVLMPITALIALAFAPEPEDRSRPEQAPLPWREGLRAMWANKPFLRLMASHALNSAANGLPAALFLFFAVWALGSDDGGAGLLLAVYFVTAILAAPFWSWAARTWSKHRAWGAAMIYSAAVFAAVFALGEGDIVAFGIIAALTGLAFGADVVLPPAMQADVCDVDTAATGRQRTGVYMAVWSVIMKAASALAAGGGLIALDFAGFDAEADVNSEMALSMLFALYAGVPIVLKLIAVALIWRFPIDAIAQADLERRINDATQGQKNA